MTTIHLDSSILEFVVYPKTGLVVDGVRFVTAIDKITGPTRPKIGDSVSVEAILHTWWCTLTLEETKSLWGDGVTFDRVKEALDVIKLGTPKISRI
jgi:hypothetical protein